MDKAEVIANARKSCDEARMVTPENLRGFIVDLPQRRNLGTRDYPDWAEFALPYMTVDGRVSWAEMEAKDQGKDLLIETEFTPALQGEWLMCRARVKTPRGTATGHSMIELKGIESQRIPPVEAGETGAIGRALGFLGYGIYGSGIASAEEVELARQREEERPQQRPAAPQQRPAAPQQANRAGNGSQQSRPQYQASTTKPPSEAQLNFVRSLAEDANWPSSEAESFIRTLRTSADASAAIQELKDGGDPRQGELMGDYLHQEEQRQVPFVPVPPPSFASGAVRTGDATRTPMSEDERKAFFAALGKVGRWKNYEVNARNFIKTQNWGTEENPQTTRLLTKDQRQAVLAHVRDLPSPSWSDLFGIGSTVPPEWKAFCEWTERCSLTPWGTAQYLMRNYGYEEPQAKKPADFSARVVETVLQAAYKGGGELFIDDVNDYEETLKAI